MACLESITTDLGKPYTQADLLTKYRQELYNDLKDKGDFGATSNVRLEAIWRDLGYKGAWTKRADTAHVRDHVFQKMTKAQAILVFSNMQGQGWHCIRFEQVLDDQTVRAMVPNFPGATAIDPIRFADLVAWDYRFALLSL